MVYSSNYFFIQTQIILIFFIILINHCSLAGKISANNGLKAEIVRYSNREKELENINQMLKDEHQALQLAFASLEEKLRKAQVQNHYLFY